MQEQFETLTSKISTKSVAKYALLPGILPMLQRLVGQLSQFLFMFTQIFGSVGLIDRNHPCLRPENIGLYRFTDIIGLAASNVVFDRKHIPQIIMFFAVILSLALMVCIGLAALTATIVNVNHAQAQFFGAPTTTPNGGYSVDNDWALLFLARIFGRVGTMFPDPGSSGNPWFTSLLTGMLKYYSFAMLTVAAFMILYLLVITVVESARTGQPFGTRFDGMWAPIRLGLAITLLMPILSGYNSAQLLTFQSAKWGSNLATNTWYAGVNNLKDNSKNFFSATMTDPGYRFLRDIFLVNLCVRAMDDLHAGENSDFEPSSFVGTVSADTITYSFGTKDAPDFCGQVTLLKSYRGMNSGTGMFTGGLYKPNDLVGTPWPEQTINDYLAIAKMFLPIPDSKLLDGIPTTRPNWSTEGHADVGASVMGPIVQSVSSRIMGDAKNNEVKFADAANGYNGAALIEGWANSYRDQLGYNSATGLFFSSSPYTDIIKNYNDWLIDSLTTDTKYGWTTAGVFYMRLSTAMSTISKVVDNPPRVTKLPSNLSKSFATPANPSASTEKMENLCSGSNIFFKGFLTGFTFGLYQGGKDVDACIGFELSKKVNNFLNGGKDWFLNAVQRDENVYQRLGTRAYDRALQLGEPETSVNMNAGYVMGPILEGLSGLAKISSGNLNPLGAVITWGDTMMTLAFIAYGIGVTGLGAGLTSLAFVVGHALIIPGFVLAFWVPMIPFLYFTFAVIEWMISILEAIIGMPLFALSLITLEGEGLGQGMSGVKRLFEIVLRPTVIVMSLLVSVIIFSASVSFFNSAFGLFSNAATNNGQEGMFSSATGGLGLIFVYMFSIYSLATSCFKLINAIPNNFGRWMGLEGGFGSYIKTGVEGVGGVEGAIVGGAVLRGVQSVAGVGEQGAMMRINNRNKKRAQQNDKK